VVIVEHVSYFHVLPSLVVPGLRLFQQGPLARLPHLGGEVVFEGVAGGDVVEAVLINFVEEGVLEVFGFVHGDLRKVESSSDGTSELADFGFDKLLFGLHLLVCFFQRNTNLSDVRHLRERIGDKVLEDLYRFLVLASNWELGCNAVEVLSYLGASGSFCKDQVPLLDGFVVRNIYGVRIPGIDVLDDELMRHSLQDPVVEEAFTDIDLHIEVARHYQNGLLVRPARTGFVNIRLLHGIPKPSDNAS